MGLRPEKRPEPNWIKFSMTRSALLRDIKNKPFYQAPPAMWTNLEDRNKERHCEYHETHGHSTDSCLALKHFLERQAKAGNLNQYLPRDLQPPPLQDHRDGRNVVNPVFGGTITPPPPGVRQYTRSPRKKYTAPYTSHTQTTKVSTLIITKLWSYP